MADIPETPPGPSSKAASEKRKPGRPSTGQALSRATIQRQYRERNKSNVTRSTVEALDENMTLRAQVLQLMNELEDAQMKARVEFELGEKARARVRELERRLESVDTGSKKGPAKARYEFQTRNYSDGKWSGMGAMGPEYTYKARSAALADLKLFTEGKDDAPYRILDHKTGQILTA
jgi:hypothetical protein